MKTWSNYSYNLNQLALMAAFMDLSVNYTFWYFNCLYLTHNLRTLYFPSTAFNACPFIHPVFAICLAKQEFSQKKAKKITFCCSFIFIFMEPTIFHRWKLKENSCLLFLFCFVAWYFLLIHTTLLIVYLNVVCLD